MGCTAAKRNEGERWGERSGVNVCAGGVAAGIGYFRRECDAFVGRPT